MKTIRLTCGFLYHVGASAGNVEEGENLGISVNFRMTALPVISTREKRTFSMQQSHPREEKEVLMLFAQKAGIL